MRNVSYRRPLSRTRTPSLTRTLSSPSSSVSNSTPQSTRSVRYQRTPSDPPLALLLIALSASLSDDCGLLLLCEVAAKPFYEQHQANYNADQDCKKAKAKCVESLTIVSYPVDSPSHTQSDEGLGPHAAR